MGRKNKNPQTWMGFEPGNLEFNPTHLTHLTTNKTEFKSAKAL